MNEQEVRRSATICIVASLSALAFNQYFFQTTGYARVFLPPIGCVGLLLGTFGYIQTDVYKYKDDWSRMPSHLKYIFVSLVIVGLLVGIGLNKYVYGIWG